VGYKVEHYLEWLQRHFLKSRIEVEGKHSTAYKLAGFLKNVSKKLPDDNPGALYFIAGMFVSLVASIGDEREAMRIVEKIFDIGK